MAVSNTSILISTPLLPSNNSSYTHRRRQIRDENNDSVSFKGGEGLDWMQRYARLEKPLMPTAFKNNSSVRVGESEREGEEDREDREELKREENTTLITDDQPSLGIVVPISRPAATKNNHQKQLFTLTTPRTMTSLMTTAISMERSIEIPAYSRFTALICCLIILILGVIGNFMVSFTSNPIYSLKCREFLSFNPCHLSF